MSGDQPATDAESESAAARTERGGRDRGAERANGGSLVADGGIRVGTLLEALADERRRYVLYYLREEENAELDDVAEQVAAWERGTPPGELDEQTRTNVRVNLYHAHLPKLEEAKIIGYDRRHGSACLRGLPDPLEEVLDYCADIELSETNGDGSV